MKVVLETERLRLQEFVEEDGFAARTRVRLSSRATARL